MLTQMSKSSLLTSSVSKDLIYWWINNDKMFYIIYFSFSWLCYSFYLFYYFILTYYFPRRHYEMWCHSSWHPRCPERTKYVPVLTLQLYLFLKTLFKILWNYYRIGCCLLKLNLNCDLIFFLILIILIFNVELNYSSKGLRVIILSSPNKLKNYF